MIQRLKTIFIGDTAGGVMLLLSAVASMIIMNSAGAPFFQGLMHIPLSIGIGAAPLTLSLHDWINDGLMAIFFFLIGMEIKREIKAGHLARLDQLMLPAVAAAGGMAVPALIYTLFNGMDPATQHGWAIPAATDIAFALGIISLLGSRVPMSVKVFLTTVAVVDDLGAIVVIALFYTPGIETVFLTLAAATTAILVLMNLLSCRLMGLYIFVGLFLWYFMLKSGVHATLAGVILGLTIPYRLPKRPEDSPLHLAEKSLSPYVAYGILPIFGLASAGVPLAGFTPDLLMLPLTLGVSLGLILGKPLGVFGTVWILAKAGLVNRPHGSSWDHLFGASLLAGIGFTMSLFISNLAFDDIYIQALSRVGILTGSVVSGIIGFLYLRFVAHPSIPLQDKG
jgi:NhaA family Na+:H+ antiporter